MYIYASIHYCAFLRVPHFPTDDVAGVVVVIICCFFNFLFIFCRDLEVILMYFYSLAANAVLKSSTCVTKIG